jgi:hypothetical protein
MLAKWTEILPLFVIRRLAGRVERMRINDMLFLKVRPDIFVKAPDETARKFLSMYDELFGKQ